MSRSDNRRDTVYGVCSQARPAGPVTVLMWTTWGRCPGLGSRKMSRFVVSPKTLLLCLPQLRWPTSPPKLLQLQADLTSSQGPQLHEAGLNVGRAVCGLPGGQLLKAGSAGFSSEGPDGGLSCCLALLLAQDIPASWASCVLSKVLWKRAFIQLLCKDVESVATAVSCLENPGAGSLLGCGPWV